MKAYRRFEQANDIPHTEPREVDRGDVVVFIGTDPDGREFGIGYQKDNLP